MHAVSRLAIVSPFMTTFKSTANYEIGHSGNNAVYSHIVTDMNDKINCGHLWTLRLLRLRDSQYPQFLWLKVSGVKTTSLSSDGPPFHPRLQHKGTDGPGDYLRKHQRVHAHIPADHPHPSHIILFLWQRRCRYIPELEPRATKTQTGTTLNWRSPAAVAEHLPKTWETFQMGMLQYFNTEPDEKSLCWIHRLWTNHFGIRG